MRPSEPMIGPADIRAALAAEHLIHVVSYNHRITLQVTWALSDHADGSVACELEFDTVRLGIRACTDGTYEIRGRDGAGLVHVHIEPDVNRIAQLICDFCVASGKIARR